MPSPGINPGATSASPSFRSRRRGISRTIGGLVRFLPVPRGSTPGLRLYASEDDDESSHSPRGSTPGLRLHRRHSEAAGEESAERSVVWPGSSPFPGDQPRGYGYASEGDDESLCHPRGSTPGLRPQTRLRPNASDQYPRDTGTDSDHVAPNEIADGSQPTILLHERDSLIAVAAKGGISAEDAHNQKQP